MLGPFVDETRRAALGVLLHNAHGPVQDLPRTAGWGYPEPYTCDLMLCLLGVGVSGDPDLLAVGRRVLETLAANQTARGHIPSLVHDPDDRGASDTTPLFLFGVGVYRRASGEPEFLAAAADRALVWMEYQSPSDRFLVAQQPTSDWRDEQWTTGTGLYVNAVLYAALRLLGKNDRARGLAEALGGEGEGLALAEKPYFAFWSFKIYRSDRFDLLGNSLAILTGLATAVRAGAIVDWVEQECGRMEARGDLAGGLPPNFFPFIRRNDPEWLPRYELFNRPGDYHNGGVWPFVAGLYVAALVAAGRPALALEKLGALTRLNRRSAGGREFGFNEWADAAPGEPRGQDWQSWSAALYLYAVGCVETGSTPFFDEMRSGG